MSTYTATEHEYKGYVIYIEESADQYNSGLEWSACKDDTVWESGVDFTEEDALKNAKSKIDRLAS